MLTTSLYSIRMAVVRSVHEYYISLTVNQINLLRRLYESTDQGNNYTLEDNGIVIRAEVAQFTLILHV